jgi:hypothetical protein
MDFESSTLKIYSMENTKNPYETKPVFENDRLTDLVLHKDEVPDIRNGEIVNEPDDVEEKAIPVGEHRGKERSGNDCWFPIHFIFDNQAYTADVKKRKADVEEYHVYDVTPSIAHLPEPFIIAEHISRAKFDFPTNETYYPFALGTSIVKAITNGNSADMNNDINGDLSSLH